MLADRDVYENKLYTYIQKKNNNNAAESDIQDFQSQSLSLCDMTTEMLWTQMLETQVYPQ